MITYLDFLNYVHWGCVLILPVFRDPWSSYWELNSISFRRKFRGNPLPSFPTHILSVLEISARIISMMQEAPDS